MNGMTNKVTYLLVCLFALVLNVSAFAERGTLVHSVSKTNTDSSAHLFRQRTDFEEPDKLYKDFFGKTDEQLKANYENQWRYHEKQVPYGLTSWKGEFFSIGSLDYYDHAPLEQDVRKGLAQQVLRIRIDAGIRAALYQIKNPSLIKAHATFKNTLDTVNNYPLRLSSKPGSKAGELRLGYDVLSDGSKIEYVQGLIEAGIYHPALVGLITNQKSWDMANLRVSTNLGAGAPSAALSVPLHRNSVEGSLSKSLSDSVSAQVVTTQPLRDQTQAHRYEARVAYTF